MISNIDILFTILEQKLTYGGFSKKDLYIFHILRELVLYRRLYNEIMSSINFEFDKLYKMYCDDKECGQFVIYRIDIIKKKLPCLQHMEFLVKHLEIDLCAYVESENDDTDVFRRYLNDLTEVSSYLKESFSV